MILGIGTDIIQISRVADSLIRTPKLADRILTPEELEYYSQVRHQATYLAKRFAAKEAVVKALGTGIGRGVSWQHIQISKDELGKPLIELFDGAKLRANELGITNFQLSYSDEKEYVVAFAIAEG